MRRHPHFIIGMQENCEVVNEATGQKPEKNGQAQVDDPVKAEEGDVAEDVKSAKGGAPVRR